MIKDDDIEKFFKSINVDIMDIVAVAVLCVMKTESSTQITYDEFEKGCDYMKVD